jgi:hypothetical protein
MPSSLGPWVTVSEGGSREEGETEKTRRDKIFSHDTGTDYYCESQSRLRHHAWIDRLGALIIRYSHPKDRRRAG